MVETNGQLGISKRLAYIYIAILAFAGALMFGSLLIYRSLDRTVDSGIEEYESIEAQRALLLADIRENNSLISELEQVSPQKKDELNKIQDLFKDNLSISLELLQHDVALSELKLDSERIDAIAIQYQEDEEYYTDTLASLKSVSDQIIFIDIRNSIDGANSCMSDINYDSDDDSVKSELNRCGELYTASLAYNPTLSSPLSELENYVNRSQEYIDISVAIIDTIDAQDEDKAQQLRSDLDQKLSEKDEAETELQKVLE